MKNLRSILAALVVLLMATAAHAQQPMVSATVPFNFAIGDRAYPAGNYLFKNDGAVLSSDSYCSILGTAAPRSSCLDQPPCRGSD